ncbi:NlpC/P60 family protein [Streptomonospora salina]|uniref:Cell wall-associated NlpC family hydrolase/FtsZ-binding cell division protein ZapB n=1 Tax=Streptomonospora salina TaxID=104205 RepID=A0A841E6Q6_9ACTN|nr:NlpC/P60 family protein [Streptomonospora salina]MBB5996989.1 cell wall-associated NlpC family hydrolase/FtsZ-binding cell division protein ZapB [Streptomonospora salina]
MRDKIGKLEEEHAELADKYNQAKEDHDAAQEKLEDLQEDKQDTQDEIDSMQEDVRGLATAAYTDADYGSPAYLLSSGGPSDSLAQAADLGYLSENQTQTLEEFTEQQDKLGELTAEAADTEEEAQGKLDEAEQAKDEAEEKLDEQQDLLDDLTAEQQESVGIGNGTGNAVNNSGASGSAGAAVDFVYAQIGDAYSLGANGPDVWDCSSLVQAAWSQAGVSLPRTTYDQVNAGTSVSWDALQPGDLIFFYSGPSHVGMYVGGNKMVHGSKPSKPVMEVSLAGHYRSNFHSAVRP